MRRVRRVEERQSLDEGLAAALRLVARPGELWATFREYVGVGRRRRLEPVTDSDSLARFLQTRASFVAHTSLYGYVRTRAGMRYPELFHDDGFVGSINIAKWQIWLACLSDISVYAGGMLAREAPASADRVGPLMIAAVSGILAETGTPGMPARPSRTPRGRCWSVCRPATGRRSPTTPGPLPRARRPWCAGLRSSTSSSSSTSRSC